eukprot:899573_1
MAASSTSSGGGGSTNADVNNDNKLASFLDAIPSSLSERIEDNKNRKKNGGKNINVIMGNEAGDADSIVSALALAYVVAAEQTSRQSLTTAAAAASPEKPMEESNNSSNTADQQPLPVLMVPLG